MSDVADYCRQVEAHLTRINSGHMVRVVGAGFALVKQWADDGVPLSVVFRAIEQKAERHKAGTSKRPLRIEFCEADVRELHAAWRRAVGLTGGAELEGPEPVGAPVAVAEPKRRSVSKLVERAIDRLGRLAGRLELPGDFRDAASQAIEQLSVLREELSRTRGAAREPLLERLAPIERDLLMQARQAVAAEMLRDFTIQAERELAPYRDRLSPEQWDRAVSVTVDRSIRDHLALPVLEL